MNNKALGFFEVKSLVVALYAADVMVKAANVIIRDFNKVGSGIICVVIEGDVAAVQAAVETAKLDCGSMAEVIGTHVIPRPVDDMEMLF